MNLIGQVLFVALWLFLIVLIFRLVMDYVFLFARSFEPKGFFLVILEAAYTVTDPPLKALRKVIPPLRLGGIALDLSFLVLFIAVQILIAIVRVVFLSG
jgi:YggT family protein